MKSTATIKNRTNMQRLGFRAGIAVAVFISILVLTLVAEGAASMLKSTPAANPIFEPMLTESLPREWTWQKKAISFDSMYRNNAPSGTNR